MCLWGEGGGRGASHPPVGLDLWKGEVLGLRVGHGSHLVLKFKLCVCLLE